MEKTKNLKLIILLSALLFLILLIGMTFIKKNSDKTNLNNSKEFIELASLGSFNPTLINNNNLEDIKFYTYALCNSSNFCQDYEITCLKNKITNMQPIKGATIQHSNDWIDPRGDKSIEELCE